MIQSGTLNLKSIQRELLSGLTVSLALVPEALAFSLVAGVPPLVGLYAAFIVGLVTSLCGGRPGMISGATGALAVVLGNLFQSTPAAKEHLFLIVVMMGIFQILFGLLKLGKLVRLIPESVMFGFVNGLALVIFKAQFKSFSGMSYTQIGIMSAVIVAVMLIIYFLPKVIKGIPPALAAIIVSSLAVFFLELDIPTVGSIAGGLPTFALPALPADGSLWPILIKTAAVLAAVGLIESLMTMTLIDEITHTRGKGNRESIAQGSANLLTGLFGGMGGCAMIGQSMINVHSGGRERLSGISSAIFLLIFILIGSPVISQIPIAALIGVMFMVVINTFEWETFHVIKKIPRSDTFVILVVTIVTVVTDLALAVIAGVVISALVFAWESAKKVAVEQKERPDGSKEYNLHGSIFFASTTQFKNLFTPEKDSTNVYIDFANARLHDHSAIEALNDIAESYRKAGKRLRLLHLSEDCRTLLKNAGDMIEVNIEEDPRYRVADDSLAF